MGYTMVHMESRNTTTMAMDAETTGDVRNNVVANKTSLYVMQTEVVSFMQTPKQRFQNVQ
jgi:hypothetical protein